jgi:hypothetical protein
MTTLERPAAVAGLFYPNDPKILDTDVRRYLSQATPPDGVDATMIKALIVPHAGYVYSGPVAATAYRLLQGRDEIRRVVLLGPVHQVPVRGLALPDTDGFRTPLGVVPVDQEAVDILLRLPQVVVSGRCHAREHSLEVHLPFLQEVIGSFSLVPLAVGDATTDEVAEVLAHVWGGPETLIVISSDLSHYLPYDQARTTDRETAEAVLRLDDDAIAQYRACGATPVRGLLRLARRRHLLPTMLDLRNSGDTEGDRDRVVGYGAFAFLQDP